MLHEFTTHLIHWLHTNPGYAVAFAFLIAFTESLAVIGSIIPGSVMMTALGGLMGMGIIPLWGTLFWATLGAIIGDTLSYLLGWHYQQRIKSLWPFSKVPKLLEKGEVFFAHHGGKSVFLARFVGPIRAFVPVIAGMMNLRFPVYITANITSAILWAPAYLLPGFLVGAASQTLKPSDALRLLAIVVTTLLIIWLASWLFRRIWSALRQRIMQSFDRLENLLKNRQLHPFTAMLLQDKRYPTAHRQFAVGLTASIALILLLYILICVVSQSGLYYLNDPLWHVMRSLRGPTLDNPMLFFTQMGDKAVLFWAWLGVLIYFCARRDVAAIGAWFLLLLCCAGSIEVIKHLIASPRPLGLQQIPHGYSFPSGHTALTTTLLLSLAIVNAHDLSYLQRRFLYYPCVLLVLCVAISRLYLGAHWLTDVLGGLCLGTLISAGFAWCYHAFSALSSNHVRLYASLMAGWLLGMLIYGLPHFSREWHHYQLSTPPLVLSQPWWWGHVQDFDAGIRLNRTGHLMAPMNVAWAGSPTDVKRILKNSGFTQPIGKSLASKLTHYQVRNDHIISPLMYARYRDRIPRIILAKPIPLLNPRTFVIIRLWQSGIEFAPGELFVGDLQYVVQGSDLRFSPTAFSAALPRLLPWFIQQLPPNIAYKAPTRLSYQLTLLSQPETLFINSL